MSPSPNGTAGWITSASPATSRAELDQWVARFDAAGVVYTPVREMSFGYHLDFRDPDNIPLEFYVPNDIVNQGWEVLQTRDVSREEVEALSDRPWWKSVEAFAADLSSAKGARLREMRDWAEQQQKASDVPGMGRNPRARRQFRQMRDAADSELDRRGLLWPSA